MLQEKSEITKIQMLYSLLFRKYTILKVKQIVNFNKNANLKPLSETGLDQLAEDVLYCSPQAAGPRDLLNFARFSNLILCSKT